MLATVFAAKMCDYKMFDSRILRKTTDADLDRFETMCAGLFSLLPEDNERTTILQERVSKYRSRIRVNIPRLWHIRLDAQPFVSLLSY
jgi:hypothetical protein